MKRTEALQVGDLLKAMMESDGSAADFDRQKLCYLWSEIVGPTVNRVTTRRFVENDTFHVYISSGPIKSELAYVTSALVDKLNEAVGRKIIKRIAIH